MSTIDDQFILLPEADRERLAERCREVAMQFMPGKRVKVTFSQAKKVRSSAQNAALWGAAYATLMDFMGMRGAKEQDELHDYFCGEFFGWKKKTILGRTKLTPKRSTTTNEAGKREIISTTIALNFYAFIQQRAAENGCLIPDPDPDFLRRAKPKQQAPERIAA